MPIKRLGSRDFRRKSRFRNKKLILFLRLEVVKVKLVEDTGLALILWGAKVSNSIFYVNKVSNDVRLRVDGGYSCPHPPGPKGVVGHPLDSAQLEPRFQHLLIHPGSSMPPPSLAFCLATKCRLPLTTAVFHPRKDAASAFILEGGCCFQRKRLLLIFEF
ncbi:hypothetical protein EDC14_102654 [Hydrogenispora ethanolica]|uniref:Uncharacterized protein n=1 Tax=Hydrogenispora ethanolica TaxID=1082276 RepID=A0A4R1R9Q7_HYDET|nr:hypothetical protein EDC14_102654 [Hydrogenispora ethanolica]